jgi:FkbM family methyltransferase
VRGRVRTSFDRIADKVAEAIAWRTTNRLVERGVRVVSPAPWHTAGDSERSRVDHHAMRVVMAAALETDGSFLDIGANEGVMLAHAVRVAPQGRHVAWEPLPQLAEKLRADFPAVEVRAAALAAEAGRARFLHLLDRSGQSGFRDRHFPDSVRREWIEVAVERLDEALDDAIVPALVKIDVEDAELGVFRGGIETLKRHRPAILFEHGLGAMEHFETLPEHLWDLLSEDVGLRIFDLDGAGPYSRDQFSDAVLTRARWNWLACR